MLILVLWISFGLVALTLYFAHAMSLELRASDNRVAGLTAEMAIEGAARYASNVVATADEPGVLPDASLYECEDVPIGEASFWFVGRDEQDPSMGLASFGLVDEASKLNLNTATAAMLEGLPGMTPELAAAIVDWRDSDDEVSENGAENESYLRLDPPYECKNAPFESVEELRLVYGMTMEQLFGEDLNLNGILDPNEDDGDLSPPNDDRDGRLDFGLMEYVTVWTAEAMTGTNVNDQQSLAPLLEEEFGADRANEILLSLSVAGGGGMSGSGGGADDPGDQRPPDQGGGNQPSPDQGDGGQQSPNQGGGGQTSFGSLLEFYIRSQMTEAEFEQISDRLSITNGAAIEGLVNVNTASEEVLRCIPGIGTNNASVLVAQREMNSDPQRSIAWVADVLDEADAIQAGPYLTARSSQFIADIVALGRHDRGYRRVRFVFDTTDGSPKPIWRQDLTHRGWALGTEIRENLELLRESRSLAANQTTYFP